MAVVLVVVVADVVLEVLEEEEVRSVAVLSMAVAAVLLPTIVSSDKAFAAQGHAHGAHIVIAGSSVDTTRRNDNNNNHNVTKRATNKQNKQNKIEKLLSATVMKLCVNSLIVKASYFTLLKSLRD